MTAAKKQLAVGVDVGGTHISACLVDLAKNKIIKDSYREAAVDGQSSALKILSTWSGLIGKVIAITGKECISNIGIAMPGPFDYINGISQIHGVGKYENLFGVDVKTYLCNALNFDSAKIHFLNDASAFALGEYHKPYCNDYKKILALTLGTGFGSTYIHHGSPLPQMLYNVPYKNSIADDYFSTRWFVSNYNKRASSKLTGVKELSERAKSGDQDALDIFKEFGQDLGNFLVAHTSNAMADCVVIGGNISKAWELFSEELEKNLPTCRVIRAEEMNTSAFIGAAFYKNEE